MKKFILSAAILLTTVSLFAANTSIEPLKAKKRTSKKNVSAFVCQVVEVKGENNQTTIMAIFSDASATNSNLVVLADAKVIENNANVTDVAEFTKQLKNKYTGIKVWGAATSK